MIIKVIGDEKTAAYRAAVEVVISSGHKLYRDGCLYADINIAPLLTKKISDVELYSSFKGTLIFHPSPLPYGRGASSIRWAYRRREPITAATWFWANNDLDAGDICESEIIKIDYSLSPREFYQVHVIPAMVRTLKRSIEAISAGYVRRVPQVEEYATYDARIV